jgi:hypothetical protein
LPRCEHSAIILLPMFFFQKISLLFFQEKIILKCKFDFFFLEKFLNFLIWKNWKRRKNGPTMVVVPNSEDVLLYPSVNWSLNIYSLQEKKIWIMPHKMYCMVPTLNPPTIQSLHAYYQVWQTWKTGLKVWYGLCDSSALSKKMVIPSTKVLWKLILDFALSISMMIL